MSSRLGYLLNVAPKDLEKVIYFASYMVTEVNEDERHEDLPACGELRLEELDAERDRLVEATRKLSVDYVPEDDDFVDDVDEDERMTAEEVDEEIADIYEEFNERKALRQDAFDAFMKIEPSSWCRTRPSIARCASTTATTSRAAWAPNPCATCWTPWTWPRRPTSCATSSPTARARSAPRPSSASRWSTRSSSPRTSRRT